MGGVSGGRVDALRQGQDDFGERAAICRRFPRCWAGVGQFWVLGLGDFHKPAAGLSDFSVNAHQGGLGVRPHPNPPPEGEGIFGCWGVFSAHFRAFGGWMGGVDVLARAGGAHFILRQAQDEMGAARGWLGAGRLGGVGFFCFRLGGVGFLFFGSIMVRVAPAGLDFPGGLGFDFQLAAGFGLGWAGAVLPRFIVV